MTYDVWLYRDGDHYLDHVRHGGIKNDYFPVLVDRDFVGVRKQGIDAALGEKWIGTYNEDYDLVLPAYPAIYTDTTCIETVGDFWYMLGLTRGITFDNLGNRVHKYNMLVTPFNSLNIVLRDLFLMGVDDAC